MQNHLHIPKKVKNLKLLSSKEHCFDSPSNSVLLIKETENEPCELLRACRPYSCCLLEGDRHQSKPGRGDKAAFRDLVYSPVA